MHLNVSSFRKLSVARRLVVCACLALLVGVAGVLVTNELDADSTPVGMTFVIPAGASERIDVPTIDSAIAIPTEIVIEPGQTATIVIKNEDSVANRAGPWVVGPGQSYSMSFDEPGVYRFECAVDASESVTITVVEP